MLETIAETSGTFVELEDGMRPPDDVFPDTITLPSVSSSPNKPIELNIFGLRDYFADTRLGQSVPTDHVELALAFTQRASSVINWYLTRTAALGDVTPSLKTQRFDRT